MDPGAALCCRLQPDKLQQQANFESSFNEKGGIVSDMGGCAQVRDIVRTHSTHSHIMSEPRCSKKRKNAVSVCCSARLLVVSLRLQIKVARCILLPVACQAFTFTLGRKSRRPTRSIRRHVM